MPTYTPIIEWSDGTTLTQVQLNDFANSVATFLNTTKIDSSNIQSGGIATANYAASSVDSAALASSAVTSAKIATNAVLTAHITDANITTAKIADAAITQSKRVALGQVVSPSCGTFSTSSTSAVDVTNLSVTITTTGRPVFLGLLSDGSVGGSQISVGSSSHYVCGAVLSFVRGSTSLATHAVQAQISSNIGSASYGSIPGSAFFHVDTPSAGTFTYKVRVSTFNGSVTFSNVALMAYEL